MEYCCIAVLILLLHSHLKICPSDGSLSGGETILELLLSSFPSFAADWAKQQEGERENVMNDVCNLKV